RPEPAAEIDELVAEDQVQRAGVVGELAVRETRDDLILHLHVGDGHEGQWHVGVGRPELAVGDAVLNRRARAVGVGRVDVVIRRATEVVQEIADHRAIGRAGPGRAWGRPARVNRPGGPIDRGDLLREDDGTAVIVDAVVQRGTGRWRRSG